MPYAFTINHHCCQQALLLAAQPVVCLALLVPEAGQALGAGQVLADSMLHTGSQAVRASGPRARRKRQICVNQTVLWKVQGGLVFASLARMGRGRAKFPKPPPSVLPYYVSAIPVPC